MKHFKIAILLAAPLLLGTTAFGQSLSEQLQAVRSAQDRIKADKDIRQRQQRAEQEARQQAFQERERERQQQAFELEKKRIEANQAIEKQRLDAAREQQARAAKERARTQAYEDEQRRLDLMERKAELAARRARADRSNDYIDRELGREDAKNNVINSNADANRNLSEGGRDMMRGIGKGVERHGLGK